ncbi:farnesyl pyrophosphate synthase-like [Phlebotomus papatasi]|uniref:farnesyl pyrophosphate synthase-like n=1 Tax=Phlebotomus papatasi TaxID=29031 RepID=UPI002483AE6B|nr:farnesyl pyrophosphate synthase-like [Phlebotomus papatasi]
MVFHKVLKVVQGPYTRNIFKYALSGNKFVISRAISTTTTVNSLGYLETKNTYTMMPNKQDIPIIDTKLPHHKGVEISDDMWLSQAKRNQFMEYFPGIVKELQEKAATIDSLDNGKHMAKVLEYVVPDGKKYGGVVTAETYKMLTPKSQQTPENLKLGYYLGWCLELFVDSINMVDDIMDGGKTRRNKTCWYRLEDVQMTAINDSFLIETGVYYLLRKNFGHLDCFMRLLELFNETAFITYMGQTVDLKSSQNFLSITMKNYEAIVMNISSYIISYFPVVLGMTLAGYTDLEIVKQARPILTELGYFYIIENDYMDCFGDPKITGKIGRDIQEGKCRWMAVACLEKASPAQREIMKTHYGRDNPESEAIIKQLYLDLNLPQVYADYAAEVYNRLVTNVEKNSYGDLKKVYLKLIETLTCSTASGGLYP